MTLLWFTFFGLLFGSMGAFIWWHSSNPLECNLEDDFKRRQKEIQQSKHTDYME